ncbi:hypothetical protein CEUSTIGMA_g13027.t1 [Chlamydomonas eustigma]|uniref:Uncharacterized protein n=1 Tax=Chlamydomonas eustigma TaxID=1157962 RepID=A0A250XRQ4_9CHLO|nr:hypothetical protein CEUSTIGMA_g13027.t1 [Chlamydomonas eustigma]|eukprot:GAX85612.1 hypothetical protein CEUSTIGMA_g13027.t1 [Chlamydomonas eustigma]
MWRGLPRIEPLRSEDSVSSNYNYTTMPVYLLYVKAELENVGTLKFKGTSFCIDVKEVGGDDIRRGVHVDASEHEEIPGGKGSANFTMKWKESKRDASITVTIVKGLTRDIKGDDHDKWVPIATLECRGLEPVGYTPEGDWEVISNVGTVFKDIDMSELEWTDYDEKLGESIGVYKITGKFELHRS